MKKYIYGLCDPDTGEVRYVGACKNLKRRAKGHRTQSHNIHCRDFYSLKGEWIRSLKSQRKDFIIKVLHEIKDGEDWEKLERKYISKFKNLLNVQKGGIHLFGEDNSFYGRQHSDFAKERIGEATIKRLTPQHLKKMRRASKKAGNPIMSGTLWKGKHITEKIKTAIRDANSSLWTLITPWGEEVQIKNLKKFSRDNNIGYHGIRGTLKDARRVSKVFKGWRVISESKKPLKLAK